MIKLIATDMDGTFLNNHKVWSINFVKQFYALKERGIRFVIASGNQYQKLFHKFLPMSQDMIFVAENGSIIVEGTKVLSTNIIAQDDLLKVRDIVSATPGLIMIMCGSKYAYVLNKDLAYVSVVAMYYASYKFVDSFDEIEDDIFKVAVYDPAYHVKEFYNGIAHQLPDHIKIVTSGNEWMDIQNKTINKGIAIQYLQQLYDIKENECMVFGDQMNDYEMFKVTKYCYAMENAVDDLKQIAYGICPSNLDEGVLVMIQDLLDYNDYE